MNNNPQQKEKRKRGRPKGSRSKSHQQKTKRQRELATAAADEAFENAFGNTTGTTDIIDTATRKDNENNSDDSVNFGLNIAPPGMDDSFGEDVEETTIDNTHENIGFGVADHYDVQELIEISNMDLRDAKNKGDCYETTDDILKDLKVGCVSNSSKNYMNLLTYYFYFMFINFKRIICTIHGLVR